jgi:hypothetical protein
MLADHLFEPGDDSVEVVVINWKRQENIPAILKRFREQTHPCMVTLIDCGGGLTAETLALADRLYSFRENYLAFNRFIPALNYRAQYTYFHDDDMLPGVRVLEHFIRHAKDEPRGALFGQVGRDIVEPYGGPFAPRDRAVSRRVDLVLRGYFLRTKYLFAVELFLRHVPPPIIFEDMALSWSLRTFTDRGSYLTPLEDDLAESMVERELPDTAAICQEPGYYPHRGVLWKYYRGLAERIRAGESHDLPSR